MLSQLVMQKF